MNEDLKSLTKWFNFNSLSLNVDKSSHIVFKLHNRNPIIDRTLHIDGENIKRVSETKFLGIIIDEHLNWHKHTQYLLLKLASGIYSLNMAKNMLPLSAKKQIYFTNVLSHLTYAMSVWGPMLSASNKRKLVVQQNKAIRSIFGVHNRTTVQPYFKKGNLLSIDELVEISLASISYRYINDELPRRITNLYEIPVHRYQTRQNNMLQVPLHTLSIYNRSFLARSPHIWLNLPDNVRNSNKLKIFKKRFCKYKLE
jgi:hypothetical protein